MDHYSYYMIRIQHVRHAQADWQAPAGRDLEPLAGIVERLSSGEKRSFADGEELLRLLSGWREGLNNMWSGGGGGKA